MFYNNLVKNLINTKEMTFLTKVNSSSIIKSQDKYFTCQILIFYIKFIINLFYLYVQEFQKLIVNNSNQTVSDYRIKTELIEKKELIVTVKRKTNQQKTKFYEGRIDKEHVMQFISIGVYFDNFQQFAEYINDPDNVHLNFENRTLEVLAKSLVKKTKPTTICTIYLKQIKNTNQQIQSELLQNVIKICDIQQKLSDQSIKTTIKGLAFLIKNLINEKKNMQIQIEHLHKAITQKKQSRQKQKQKSQQSREKFKYKQQNSKLREKQVQQKNIKLEDNLVKHEIEYYQNGKVKASAWVNSECFWYYKLQFSQNIIKFKNQNLNVHIFGKKLLTQDCYSYSIIYRKLSSQQNRIGIISQAYRVEPEIRSEFSNIIYCTTKRFSGWNIAYHNNYKKFKKRVPMSVVVSFKYGTVQWIVGDQVLHKAKSSLLFNKSIKWVPYFQIGINGEICICE